MKEGDTLTDSIFVEHVYQRLHRPLETGGIWVSKHLLKLWVWVHFPSEGVQIDSNCNSQQAMMRNDRKQAFDQDVTI